MIKFLLLILVAGCSTSRFPSSARTRFQDFSSGKEAKNFIVNKANYLKLLFEQSHDPYYGTPRWTPECLDKNRVGKVEEKYGNTFLRNQLFLNNEYEPGFCQGSYSDVIWIQCKDEKRVTEIICRADDCRSLLDENPCVH
ncbi:MAG: hypothetical protein ACJ76H_02820 [Bacteriovoracaceae bacterium]